MLSSWITVRSQLLQSVFTSCHIEGLFGNIKSQFEGIRLTTESLEGLEIKMSKLMARVLVSSKIECFNKSSDELVSANIDLSSKEEWKLVFSPGT